MLQKVLKKGRNEDKQMTRVLTIFFGPFLGHKNTDTEQKFLPDNKGVPSQLGQKDLCIRP